MIRDKAILKELIGYVGASAVALAVDVALLMATHHLLGVTLWLASAIGFSTGIVVIYRLSVDKVFTYRRYEGRIAPEFGWFLITGIIGLVFTTLTVPQLVVQFGWPVLVAKGFVVGFVFTFNFIARKLVLFTKKASA